MNQQLLKLISFWSAWFVGPSGRAVINPGLHDKLIELLNLCPDTFEGISELRKEASLLANDREIARDHPFNHAMFTFILKHEDAFSDEFRGNLKNIKYQAATIGIVSS